MNYDKFKNVWTSDSGALLRKDNCAVVREVYQYTYQRIRNSQQMRATLRNGGYAWPGGYPLYMILQDGCAMCVDCARKEYKQVARARRYWNNDDSFGIVACDVNYENNDLYCDHCNKQIESAYGED